MKRSWAKLVRSLCWPRCFLFAGHICLAVVMVACQTSSPENTAKQYALSRGAVRWLIRADSIRSLKEGATPPDDGFSNPVVDSAHRLIAPVGDTAAVEIFGRVQAFDTLSAEMARADSAGLLRDSVSTESFRRAALQKLPWVSIVDTLWVVKENAEWRVWRGDDLNARLDSLGSTVQGVSPDADGQFIPFADRLAAAKAAKALLGSPRRLIAEKNDDERVRNAISIAFATERNMREHPPKVKVLRSSPARISIAIPGISSNRVFALHFRVKGTDGNWSTEMNETLVGSAPTEFTPSVGLLSPLTIDPVSPPLEIISYFEIDPGKMRGLFGLPR